MDDSNELKQRVQFLEKELETKNKDLEIYRQELVKANQQLQALVSHVHSQLKKALEIQRQIVPTEFPHLPGFELSSKFMAGEEKGGDYFDLFESKDKMQFGILMSTSSSYSVSASFLSLFMKFSFAARQNPQAQLPKSFLQLLQEEWVPQMPAGESLHCFYAAMSRRYMRLEYTNWGGVVAIHHNHLTQALTRLQFKQEMLSSHSVLSGGTVELLDFEPKDKLVLCSPGIFKVKNSAGEFFSEDKLYSTIKKSGASDVHNLRNEIVFQLQQFAQQKTFPQDVTILVMEAKDRVLKLA